MDDIAEPVSRRHPLRATAGALGVVAMVAAVTAAAVVIAHDDGSPPQGQKSQAGDSPSETPPSTPALKVSPNFDCGHGGGRVDIFSSVPPPIDSASLAEQQSLAARIKTRDWSGFTIVTTEPTHLGLVVFVDRNWDAANKALLPEGVRMVALPAEEVGSVHDQAMSFLDDPLGHAIEAFRHRTRGIDGYHSAAVWPDAGAIVIDWKAPIPDEVMALAGKGDDGVEVIVQPSRYSEKDLNAGTQRVQDAIEAETVDAKWTSMTGCDDGSGIVVGIQKQSIGDRKDELEKQLTAVAGMPVHVNPEEPIDDLVLRVTPTATPTPR